VANSLELELFQIKELKKKSFNGRNFEILETRNKMLKTCRETFKKIFLFVILEDKKKVDLMTNGFYMFKN